MQVLITNSFLANQTGSELYVRDIALGLSRRGHAPMVYSPRLGPLAETLKLAGIPVVDDLDKIPHAPDLIHGQHHLETMTALARFPDTPAVYFCHGWVPWEEIPPRHPRILRYVAVSARIQERMGRLHGIEAARIHLILNFADLLRFQPRLPLPDCPHRAVAFSNLISEANGAGILRSACARHGIRLRVMGRANGNASLQPELLLPQYDLVFARGRSALEAMATGSAVVCCDVEGLGPMVTTSNFAALRKANFGIQVLERPLSRRGLRDEIGQYDPCDAAQVSRRVRQTAGLDLALDQILDVYGAVLAEWQAVSRTALVSEQPASFGYLRFLSESIRNPGGHLSSADFPARSPAQEWTPLRAWLEKGLGTGLLALHDLKRWLSSLRQRTEKPSSPVAETSAQQVPESPQLACVVLSLGNQPTLVQAVQSLLLQDVPLEIVVVNSCGGGTLATLEAAGIRVRVISHERRLLPGAARNVGILATRAPFVAFLAADCLAEPGWAAARLRRHLGGAPAVSSAVTSAYPGNRWARASHVLLFSHRMPGVPVHRALHYGVSYDRRLFDRYGLFREDLRTGEDSEFNARFTSAIPIAWVPEVRSAHFHPTTLAGVLGDQYARGIRMAKTLKHLTGKDHRSVVARNALSRTPHSLRIAWKASSWSERLHLPGVALVALPASAAYALGALRAERIRAEEPEPVPPPRILALLTFHNEMRFLPDYFRNVAAQVDGIIALDDGSTDGSGDFVDGQASVIELIRLPARSPHVWDEPRNRRLLVQAAWEHAADWLLVVDADERLELGFRPRASAEIERAEREGVLALRVHCCELWDNPETFRVDGIWGNKRPVRLFRMRRDHEFDDRPLHGHWAPLNSQLDSDYRAADLLLYHLAMLTAEDRRARQEKYLSLDPRSEHQAIGYDYLTDETGLELAKPPPGRGYEPPKAPRLFALLVFHNEMRYLEDYFRNVPAHVDGIIALDDGSTDGSGAFVGSQPSVIQLIRLPPRSPHVWDEPANRRMIISEALKHGPDWFIAVDADERLERDFRTRALVEIAKAEPAGILAFGVKFRELWNSPESYRADGVWGRKSQARFFKARADHAFDPRQFHGHWAPLNSKHNGGFPEADLIIYHLRMIHPRDRLQRMARYLELDPEKHWQPIGYEYLTDTAGLHLEPLPPGREYEPVPISPDPPPIQAEPAADR
jgi:glycosyltransferase involved in cell wall biosynthesis